MARGIGRLEEAINTHQLLSRILFAIILLPLVGVDRHPLDKAIWRLQDAADVIWDAFVVKIAYSPASYDAHLPLVVR